MQDQHRDEREGKGERDREENGHRMDEMLELRRQNHVHEHHRQSECDQEILERLDQLLRPAGKDDLIFGRQIHFLEHVFDVLHRVGERITRRQVADNGDFALALEAIDLIRPARLFESHKIRQLHQGSLGSVDVRRERKAVPGARTHHDFAQ